MNQLDAYLGMNADVLLAIRLYYTEDGGRPNEVGGWPQPYWAVPLEFDGNYYDCRMIIGREILSPGRSYRVSAVFLSKETAMLEAVVGRTFKIWDCRFVGEGEVLGVAPITNTIEGPF